jgi:divalent metal cation (Fe/Co/Zn/Cd) transporter
MPRDMILKHTHDCALALQKKVEALPSVERAFVHVDYQRRDEDEHNELLQKGSWRAGTNAEP